MTIVEALKQLYTAMGGAEDVSSAETITEVLGFIADLYEGEHADTIAEAIANIAEVYEGGSPEQPVLISKTITENNTYNASDDDADGYSSVTVNVPTGAETFDVTITAQGEVGSYTWSANKTYLETMAAIQNGDVISVTLIFDGYTGNATGYFILHTETDDIITVVIDAEDTEDPSTKAISVLKWYSNDTFEVAIYTPSNA